MEVPTRPPRRARFVVACLVLMVGSAACSSSSDEGPAAATASAATPVDDPEVDVGEPELTTTVANDEDPPAEEEAAGPPPVAALPDMDLPMADDPADAFPDLVGLDRSGRAEPTSQLMAVTNDRELRLGVREYLSCDGTGQVTDQRPLAGASIAAWLEAAEDGNAVYDVAMTVRCFEIPDVVGLTYDEATRTLEDLIDLDSGAYWSSAASCEGDPPALPPSPDTPIVDQSPAAGTTSYWVTIHCG